MARQRKDPANTREMAFIRADRENAGRRTAGAAAIMCETDARETRPRVRVIGSSLASSFTPMACPK